MKILAILKTCAFKRIYFFFVTVTVIVFTTVSFADEIPPTPHNVILSVNMDKASLPPAVMIFDHVFGGQTTPAKDGDASMINQNRWNSLTCLSRIDTTRGACPTNLYWGNGMTAPTMAGSLVLRFTQQGTGKSVDLTINGIKNRPTHSDVSLWNAVGNTSGLPITMSASIPRSELLKLTPGSQPWKANLVMNLSRWSDSCVKQYDVNIGCPGTILFSWTADITLRITDAGTQQIYFPEYGVSNPVVDLGLKINKFGTSSATARVNKTIDMCLYDGSNSSSSQISLLFSDEGRVAPGRAEGNFSLYRSSKFTDSTNRLDYSVSVVNPKTGGPQPIVNGREIVWTGINADEGTIRTRFVKLPNINSMVRCVPAPLTLMMPEFKLSSKAQGYYTGILSVIYTPTTQSRRDIITAD